MIIFNTKLMIIIKMKANNLSEWKPHIWVIKLIQDENILSIHELGSKSQMSILMCLIINNAFYTCSHPKCTNQWHMTMMRTYKWGPVTHDYDEDLQMGTLNFSALSDSQVMGHTCRINKPLNYIYSPWLMLTT